jgi:hypothetical protein
MRLIRIIPDQLKGKRNMRMTIALIAFVALPVAGQIPKESTPSARQAPSPEDYWVSLFHRMAATTPNDTAAVQESGVVENRLAAEDSASAQKELAVLADVYEKHPETRVLLSGLLFGAVQRRGSLRDSAEAFKPILPTLMGHFLDPDRNTRLGAVRVFWFLQPSPPLEALAPVVSLSYTETDSEIKAMALQILRRFCPQSKQAVFALRDAALDQDNRKRFTALGVIGQSESGEPPTTCRDSELVDALLQGLKSGQPDVVRQAVHAAERFGRAAEPLKSELESIAADQRDTTTAAAARATLSQLQR